MGGGGGGGLGKKLRPEYTARGASLHRYKETCLSFVVGREGGIEEERKKDRDELALKMYESLGLSAEIVTSTMISFPAKRILIQHLPGR